ncbi:hypothetical protein WDW89_08075 [Deltaproteobacteria bacterium TL4]
MFKNMVTLLEGIPNHQNLTSTKRAELVVAKQQLEFNIDRITNYFDKYCESTHTPTKVNLLHGFQQKIDYLFRKSGLDQGNYAIQEIVIDQSSILQTLEDIKTTVEQEDWINGLPDYVEDTGDEILGNIPISSFKPDPKHGWENILSHVLRPEASGELQGTVFRQFHSQTDNGAIFGSVELGYQEEFIGKANVYTPLEGEVMLATESSVWIIAGDETIHRFSNIELNADILSEFRIYDANRQGLEPPQLEAGELIGETNHDQKIQYDIYGMGDPKEPIWKWNRFNPEEYWNHGGLGLEVVTAKGSEGVSIEEGSQEQLTFRLKVAHTGEIKLKLRFNYEGTAEEDRVFSFYYETVGADGSRVQHYESELEVIFPATEADGSDQGNVSNLRI